MKTTIDLPDALAAEAKEYAREHHTTLRELVVNGLRAEVGKQQSGSRPVYKALTFTGNGVLPGLTPERILEMANERE